MVVDSHPENFQDWYKQKVKASCSQSTYNMFKKYVFAPAFDDVIVHVEEITGNDIPGRTKLLYHSKLCGSLWQEQILKGLIRIIDYQKKNLINLRERNLVNHYKND